MTTTQRFSGERLKQLRLSKGMTQSQLARHSDVREQQVIRWETERNVPSANGVAQLAAALGVEVGAFYEAGQDASADDDEESDLLDAAHALDRAGEYSLADVLRRRARAAAVAQREMVREGARR